MKELTSKRFGLEILYSKLSLLLVIGHLATDAFAQGTVFTDRAAFNAALFSSNTITFTGLTDPNPTGTSPITVSGVTFTNTESRLFVSGGYLFNFDSSYPVGIYLPIGMNAFGADFSGGNVANSPFLASLTVRMSTGQTYNYSFGYQPNVFEFFGVIIGQPIITSPYISSIVFNDGGQFFPGTHGEMIDNFTFGRGVPEPSVLALALGGGLIGLLLRGRKA